MTIKRRRRRAATPKPAALPDKPIKLASVIEPHTDDAPEATVDTIAAPATPPPTPPVAAAAVAVASDPPAPRRRRASVGGHALKLSAPSKEGQKRRWVNDDGNRIAEMRELGYEFVSETGIQTADPGSRVTRLVGTKANGDPLHAYLMETPDELYAQGEAEKEAACRLIDEAITAGRDSTGRPELQSTSYGHGSVTTDR